MEIRHDWTLDEIKGIYEQPVLELVFQAATLHRRYHPANQVQVCHLISVKTGGCPENCKYCAQSSRYQTPVQAQPLMQVEEVLARAKKAIDRGATRICLGAAWRSAKPNKQFEQILEMVSGISAMGAEVCCTLGMLDPPEAKRLAEAGAYAYNHNLDTSEKFYEQIVTTRTYADRLRTLDVVEEAKLSVCCGGILGMGESVEDRLMMLQTLVNRPKHPGSVPINLLTPVPGTPFESQPRVPVWEYVRMIGTARLLFPKALVRLSCGRVTLSIAEQALCFMAGANSIHSGEVLLTVANPAFDADEEMFKVLGLVKMCAVSERTCCQ